MRFNCDKNFALVIKKHEDGKVFDLKTFKVEHHGDIHYMTMQRDGNLVIYSTEGKSMWHSRTYGNHEAYLVLQDDGNLVIYKDRNNVGKDPIWSTGTFPGAQRYDYWWSDGDTLLRCADNQDTIY